MRSCVTLGLICVLAISADVRAGEKTDVDKIQGKWQCVAGQRGGMAMSADDAKMIVVTFTKDKMSMDRNGQQLEMGYKLDPTKKPKAMDVDLPNGKKGTGIYVLEGDTLKVCHGEEGDPRPTEFVSKQGTKVTVIEFKRAK
jgi:uncharacterized protein (TIGR03067 family)